MSQFNFKLKFSNNNIHLIAVLTYFILTTVSYLTTTSLSKIFVDLIRPTCVLLLVMYIPYIFFERKIKAGAFIGLLLFLLILAIGLFLSLANAAIDVAQVNLFQNIFLAMLGILLFSSKVDVIFPERLVFFVVVYTYIGFILILATGGLELGFPPHFNFEYLNDGDKSIQYSQGLSKFFGFGALACAFLLTRIIGAKRILFFLVSMILFLFLSLLAGARGDSVIAIILCFLIILKKFPKALLVSLLFAILFLNFAFSDFRWIEDLLIYQRFMSGDAGIGDREQLFNQSILLLENNPSCLIFGCGFGYFQSYFGYEAGMYPHNIFSELLIVFGFPFVAFLSAFTFLGIRLRIKGDQSNDAFFVFFIYAIFLNLKSGTILGSWLTLCGILYYSSIFLKNVFFVER